MEDFLNFLIDLNLKNIELRNNKIIETISGQTLVKKIENNYYVDLLKYDDQNRTYIYRYNFIHQIIFPVVYDYVNLFAKNFKVKFYLILEKLFQINKREINKIRIINDENIFKYIKNELKISIDKFDKALDLAKNIYITAKSYKQSTENYLINKNLYKFNNHEKRNYTYLKKGEFEFVIDKLNIEKKEQRKEFLEYLNKDDILSLQELTEKMIKFEIFDNDFLRRLDDYFIREKLQDIINLGKKILKLGSESLDSKKAKKIIDKITNNKSNKKK